MKKKILVVVLALFTVGYISAQVSSTPEVPRNYKPKPKELLPMPDSLNTDNIFPVLGKYDVANKNGDQFIVNIKPDDAGKGTVWVSGLPQGKFKADLRIAPAIYKIPAQKTLMNDAEETETVSSEATVEKSNKAGSGKPVEEGTLIYDKDANALYIHFGSKFKEDDPASVFPELGADTLVQDNQDNPSAKEKKKSKAAKGITYTGTKVLNQESEITQ